MTDTPLERIALEAARDAMAKHGITISLPWEGDLDDLDLERCEALRQGCSNYHMTMQSYVSIQEIEDNEMRAIAFCIHVLQPLTTEAKRRIMDYLSRRFGVV